MKKRILSLITVLVIAVSLTACHKTEDVAPTTAVTTETTLMTEAETTTTTKSTTITRTVKETTGSTTTAKKQVNLAGSWEDRYSQRASMDVTGGKNQVYNIHIHWGSSAMESEDWSMTGTFNEATGELTYKDCTRMTITFSEDGTETDEVQYKNGTGKFLYKNGELRWQDNNDDYVNDCVFVR